MLVRNRLENTSVHAEVLLRRGAAQRAQFVLVTLGADGVRTEVGPIAAAIGFELVAATPAERSTLALAGFRLRQRATTMASLNAILPRARRRTAWQVDGKDALTLRRDPPETATRRAHGKTRTRTIERITVATY